jgi:acyl-CoA thioesterase FadM
MSDTGLAARIAPPEGQVEARLQLRWRDVDSLGHTTNSVYHDFLAEIRSRAIEGLLGLDPTTFVLARVELDHRNEVRLAEREVIVTARIVRIGRRSITVEHEVLRPDRTVAAAGSSVLVGWDREARAARDLDELAAH